MNNLLYNIINHTNTINSNTINSSSNNYYNRTGYRNLFFTRSTLNTEGISQFRERIMSSIPATTTRSTFTISNTFIRNANISLENIYYIIMRSQDTPRTRSQFVFPLVSRSRSNRSRIGGSRVHNHPPSPDPLLNQTYDNVAIPSLHSTLTMEEAGENEGLSHRQGAQHNSSVVEEHTVDDIHDDVQEADDEINSEFSETIITDSNDSSNVIYLNFPHNTAAMQTRTRYYTRFEYFGYDFTFHHQTLLSPNEADFVLQQILSQIYEHEERFGIETGLQSRTLRTVGNNELVKQDILKHIVQTLYTTQVKRIIKNDSCPICLDQFALESDEVCYFTTCFHAFKACFKEKFINTFTKCPLCNVSLLSSI